MKLSGQVKWFDSALGFGFVARRGGPDVFVSSSCLVEHGYKTLEKGDLVEFSIVERRQGPQADSLKRVSAG